MGGVAPTLPALHVGQQRVRLLRMSLGEQVNLLVPGLQETCAGSVGFCPDQASDKVGIRHRATDERKRPRDSSRRNRCRIGLGHAVYVRVFVWSSSLAIDCPRRGPCSACHKAGPQSRRCFTGDAARYLYVIAVYDPGVAGSQLYAKAAGRWAHPERCPALIPTSMRDFSSARYFRDKLRASSAPCQSSNKYITST